MCATCGCGEDATVTINGRNHGHDHDHSLDHVHRDGKTITLEQDVLAKNNHIAEHNRVWLRARDVCAVNLMSSPGSGKTTLLERTVRQLGGRPLVCVVEGDQETPLDADRIRATGCRAVQVNTGTGCHLDAQMLDTALRTVDPPPGSLVFVENVGNLVCPALFDLGETRKVVIMSVTEGEDKPLKYPHMFRAADLLLLNKTDLLQYLDFDVDSCERAAHRVNPALHIMRVSARTGDGVDDWCQWLRAQTDP